MAPTRRRRSADEAPTGIDEEETTRSRKNLRLSNGSSVCTNGTSSTAESSSVTDMEEEEEFEEELGGVSDTEGSGARPKGKGKAKPKAKAKAKAKGKRRAEAVADDRQDDEEEGVDINVGGKDTEAEGGEGVEAMAEAEGAFRQIDSLFGAHGEGPRGDSFTAAGDTSGGAASGRERMEKTVSIKRKREDCEAGIISKISIVNFMCHRKFEVKFGRHVNFISGRNGSGKSAILAALQVCLGAKANSTHRATKLSQFIRQGFKGEATLAVTLVNTPDGYKFNEYGSKITISRHIKPAGGGRYEMRNEKDVVVSESRAELDKMLDALNIQVDNPCALLDQENSKKFLRGNENDKFNFFMKATDLDRISAYLTDIGEKITLIKLGHHRAVEQLPRYRNIVAELRAELKEYESLEELDRKIRHYKEAEAWSYVAESEEYLAQLEAAVTKKAYAVETFASKEAEIRVRVGECDERKKNIKDALDGKAAALMPLNSEAHRVSADLASAQAPLLILDTQRKNLTADINRKRELKHRAQKALKDARNNARRNASGRKEQILHDQLQDVDMKLSETKALKDAGGGEEKLFVLDQTLATASEAAERSRGEFQQAQQELVARRKDLDGLNAGNFDPLTALGGFMPGIVQCVKQRLRDFRTPPVGPIGAFVQLKEECKGFQVAIEAHIRATLGSFVVSCQADKSALQQVMKSFRNKSRGRWPLPTIIVQQFGARHQPPRNPPGALQIMQAINVANDEAFNALVDQSAIEKICLFGSKREAESVCLVGRSGQFKPMPHGMQEAYYPSLGGKSCSKFSVRDGNIQTRTNVVNSRNRRILGVDEGTQRLEADAQVREADAEMKRLHGMADAASRAKKDAEAAADKERWRRSDLAKKEKELVRRKQKIDSELMAVRAETNDVDPVHQFEADVEEASENLASVEQELATMVEQIREATLQIIPFKEARAAAKKELKEASDECKKLSADYDEVSCAENNENHRLSRVKAKLTEAEDEAEKLSRRKELAAKEVEDNLRKAQLYMENSRRGVSGGWDGRRVRSKYNQAQLNLRAEQSKKRYEEEQAKRQLRGKSKGEVELQLANAVQKFRDEDALVKKLENNMNLLVGQRLERSEKWHAMRTYMARKTSLLFNRYLQEKGASGEVRFNFDDSSLGLTYQKDVDNDNSQCSDVKCLSGGERSFATLALLLAMGAGHECPFRVMDEFDVFMDAQSRNIAIKQVMTFAKADDSRQFILITPQDLDSVTPSDTVTIIKMPDPRRVSHDQGTLNFAPDA